MQTTLLLVDDERSVLKTLRRLFRREGYDVVTATNGSDALRQLAKVDVSVVVSDYRMPGMSGTELLTTS